MSRELPTTSQTSSLRTHPRVRRGISKPRSEEHTSELQSPCNLVCRLLLEKKKKTCTFSRSLANRSTYARLSVLPTSPQKSRATTPPPHYGRSLDTQSSLLGLCGRLCQSAV